MSNKNFDFSNFKANLKASKPPYKCPIKHCEKVYRSLAGMQQHFDSHENSLQKNARKRGKHQSINSLRGKSDKKFVEIELGGQLIQFDASKPLKLVNTENGKKPSSITYLRTGKTTNHKNHINASLPLDCEEPTSLLALPEPKFKILDAYIRRPSLKQANNPDLDVVNGVEENIFYDADEEDLAWLELIKEPRPHKPRQHMPRLPTLTRETFEKVLDLFERLCHFEHRHDNVSTTRDEDAVCSVCLDGECLNNNVILFCDLCNLAVHQECYGVPHIPDGPWTCRRCLLSPSKVVDCCLCPSKIGAMKQTDDGRWAHIVCALWIPDAGFANSVFLEPIDGIEKISPARWKLTCHICKRKSAGACIQCHKASCYTAFHVTCAQQAGLHMKIESFDSSSLSLDHAHHRNSSTNNVPPASTEHLAKFSIAQSNWLKTVYCSAHTPRRQESGKESDSDGGGSIKRMSTPTKAAIRRARKLVAEGKEVLPLLSFPTLDNGSYNLIQNGLPLDDQDQVMEKLKNYWLLKRRSRNGVPLVTHPDSYCLKKTVESSNDDRNERSDDDNDVESGDDDDDDDDHDNESIMESKSTTSDQRSCSANEEKREELRNMKRLRQELERVRLLNELIRKRERVKLKLLHHRELILRYKLNPVRSILDLILDNSSPMTDDEDDVTDVSDCSRSELDLFKMVDLQRKVNDLQYVTVKEFGDDFEKFCDAKRSKVGKGSKRKVTSFKKMGLGIIKRYESAAASLASSTNHSHRIDATNHDDDQQIASKQEPSKDNLNHLNSTFDPVKLDPDRHNSIPSAPSSFVPPLPPPVPFSLPLATSSTTSSSSVHSSVLMRPPKKRRQHFVDAPPDASKQLDENDNLRLLAEAADSISSENSRDPNADNNKPLESIVAVPASTDQPQSSTRSKNQSQTSILNSNDSQSKTIEACDSTTDWPIRECDTSLKRKIGKTKRSKNSSTEREHRKSKSCNEDLSDDNDDSVVDDDDDDDDPKNKTPKMSFTAEDDKDESNSPVSKRETRKRSCETKDFEEFLIPLSHGDFVWAQYAKFPAYPAIIVDPSKLKSSNVIGPTRSRTSRSLDGLVGINKGDVIPVPTDDIVMANLDKEKYLVCFFDQKRTWQWISRSKLDPLGVDSGLDRKKMSEVKRNNTRKPIIEAYKRALDQRCIRYGENRAQSLAVVLDQ